MFGAHSQIMLVASFLLKSELKYLSNRIIGVVLGGTPVRGNVADCMKFLLAECSVGGPASVVRNWGGKLL